MADAYSYRLLVELEENNIPRLKNKLVKYFQSKKSNGGDCEVEYERGSRTATLRFRTEEDQRNVLGKEVHQISLDKSVLKMTVRLPPDQKAAQESPPDKLNKKAELTTNNKQSSADDPTAAADVQTEEEEELCSTLAVIGNIPESFDRELLELLVENLLKDVRSSTASQDFTLEVLPAISSAVVTFQSEKGNTDWCTPNRIFSRKGLSVRPLEVTKQVVVEDMAKYNEDFLQMYFEKEGGDVENVLLNEVEQSAIITFKDHRAVQKVLKKHHHIKQKELRVYPFYESLGTALYALFIGDNASKPQKEADFVIEAQKIDPACFHICGDSQTKVDSAKQWINDLFNKEYVTNTFSEDAILSLSTADQQHTVDMQKTMGVCIRTESKKSKATITIEGFTKDVLKATTEIHDMLT